MSWRAPIPTLIPDRVVIPLHRWGVDERTLRESIDDVCAAIRPLWDIGPTLPGLQFFFESRTMLEHGIGTALLARVLSRNFLSTGEIDHNQLLELSFLHDIGLSTLPPNEQDLPSKSLPADSRARYLVRGMTGYDLVAGLDDQRPNLGGKILKVPRWQILNLALDTDVIICGFCSTLDNLLRHSAGRTDEAILNELHHEIPPRHFVRLQRALEMTFPQISLKSPDL